MKINNNHKRNYETLPHVKVRLSRSRIFFMVLYM